MEKLVQFRDRQEAQAGDFSNIGEYAQESTDRIVREGMTDQKRYTGFAIAKTGATKVTIGEGTYWTNGERYIREESTEIDFLGNLPLLTRKIAAIIATGSTVPTEVEARDFLIDVETGATEPDSVAMQSLRYASFQVQYGVENATPQKPTITTDVIVVGWVTLTTTGVDTIEMELSNELMSMKKLDARTTELEVWKGVAGEQLVTLGTDITSLSGLVNQSADGSLLTRIFSDVAAIKERLELEDDYAGYGADNFLAYDQSNSDNAYVGYSAKVEEGLRFPDANASEVSIQLFNPLDPSVKVASDGLCLPKYTEVRRISVDTFKQELSLSQYEFQTVDFKKTAMSAKRLRFGLAFTVCNNSEFWKTGKFDYKTGVFTDKLGRTYQALGTGFDDSFTNKRAKFVRLQQFWYDTETTYYEDRVYTEFSVAGAMSAQTFLNTQGGWMTSVDLYFTQKASTGNVRVLITETDSGKPNLDRVIAETTLDAANIVKGSTPSNAAHWTRVPIIPTALEAGARYAIVLITGGDHYVGLASGVTYAAGTLFYSTDGAFFQGDLTLDMMFRANFASFENSRIEVDLGSLNLSGGINSIDIAYEGIVPSGCDLSFDIRPQGNSRWFPLGADGDNPFAGLPALVSFRAVFVGTKDLMPGFKLTDSSVTVQRPATAFLHFTDPIPLPSATQSIKVVVLLDQFKEADHDYSCALIDVTNANAVRTPASFLDETIEDRADGKKRIRRTYTFNATSIPVATSSIRIRSTGATVGASSVYHVERRTYLSF